MLKYKDKISTIHDCPNSNSSAIKKDGYRFVFKNLSGNSFIPVVIQQPKRAFKNAHDKCSGCGLSMFATENQAKARFNDLIKRNKNIHKSIGSKLALVKVAPKLGVCTKEGGSGHFDFYEHIDCELKLHSSIVGDLL